MNSLDIIRLIDLTISLLNLRRGKITAIKIIRQASVGFGRPMSLKTTKDLVDAVCALYRFTDNGRQGYSEIDDYLPTLLLLATHGSATEAAFTTYVQALAGVQDRARAVDLARAVRLLADIEATPPQAPRV